MTTLTLGLRPSAALASVLIGLVFIAWFPFRPGFDGPYPAQNGATFSAEGTLTLTPPAVAHAVAPPEWAEAARTAVSFTVRVAASSSSTDLRGPARIVTYSRNSKLANWMIGQEGDALVVRWRRPGSGVDGEPRIEVPAVFDAAHVASASFREVEVQATGGQLVVRVDGLERARADLGPNAASTWATDYRVALGNEHTMSRPWRGVVREAQVEVDGRTYDLATPSAIEVPARFWHIPERARELFELDRGVVVLTAGAHVAIFGPLGWTLVLFLARPRAPRRILWIVACAAATLSLGLELGKLLFAERHPSALHVVPDCLGAIAGAWLATVALARVAPSQCPCSNEEFSCAEAR